MSSPPGDRAIETIDMIVLRYRLALKLMLSRARRLNLGSAALGRKPPGLNDGIMIFSIWTSKRSATPGSSPHSR